MKTFLKVIVVFLAIICLVENSFLTWVTYQMCHYSHDYGRGHKTTDMEFIAESIQELLN